MQIESICVISVLKECINLTADMAMLKGCEVTTDCDSGWLVKNDYTRFKQVILNLLSNAIKYNKPQGKVNIRCQRLSYGVLRISVIDTGMGIAGDMFDEVFKPFNRLSAANSSIEGTGIGLTLSKKIVTEMKGTIDFESRLGKGSHFWIDIPLVEQTIASEQDNISHKQQLLYIDGDDQHIGRMENVFAGVDSLGFVGAADVELALESSQHEPVMIIIIDMDKLATPMVDVIGRIREIEPWQKIPMIILSSTATHIQISEGLAAGCDQVLVKPLADEKLLEIIEFTLPQTQHNQE